MLYTLMHKRIPVVELNINDHSAGINVIGKVFEPEHLPVGIGMEHDKPNIGKLIDWWDGRAIPASRSGLREALDILQVSYAQRLLTKCYGLSLSDQYWICPKDSGLKWDDINFFTNPFSEDVGNALFGKELRDKPNLMSPDNTSDGWLRKKWVIIDGIRCLIKCGSNPYQQEPLNEVMATNICERIQISHIPYALDWDDDLPYSICEDFITPQTELVSAWYIMQTHKQANHISKHQHYLNCCETLGIPGVKEHLNTMLTLDYLILNEDRHLNNFGAVRNAETLEWISPAPIYDSGTSLWYNRQAFGHELKQAPSKPFRNSHTKQIELVTDFDWLDFNALDGIAIEFDKVLSVSPHINEERRKFLCQALEHRVELLETIVQGQEQQSGMTFQ